MEDQGGYPFSTMYNDEYLGSSTIDYSITSQIHMLQ